VPQEFYTSIDISLVPLSVLFTTRYAKRKSQPCTCGVPGLKNQKP